MNYKVAVVGAGPGGVVLARQLAGNGIDVTIYEKNSYEELGHDWSDAVEVSALRQAGLDMPVLDGLTWRGSLVKEKQNAPGLFEKHAVPRLKICSPGLVNFKEVDFHMITTDRRRLGQLLVKQAVEAGAKILYRREARGLLFRENGKKGPDGVEIEGLFIFNRDSEKEEVVKANLVIESSGFHSILRTGLPVYTGGLAKTFIDSDYALVHREVRPYHPSSNDQEPIPDHYRYGYHTGYQWTHIHNEDSIDIGAGVRYDPKNPDPKDIIEEFISRHPSIKAEKIRGGRSLCIVGSPLVNFVTNGFMVIGDAASTSVPTTGCGAGSAITNGLMAAEVIIEAACDNSNDIGKLWDFNARFYLQCDRGPSYAALATLRTMLQGMSHDELDYLFSKNLMDAGTLENAVNGIFKPPDLKKMIQSLSGGIANPKLLIKLNRAVGEAVRVYRHFKQYPEKWDGKVFEKWRAERE